MRIHINPISNHKYDYDIYDNEGTQVESFPSATSAVMYVITRPHGHIKVTYGKAFIAGDKRDQIDRVRSLIRQGKIILARCGGEN